MGLTAIQLANVVDALRRLKADTPEGIRSLHTGYFPYVVLEPKALAGLFPDAMLQHRLGSDAPFSVVVIYGDTDLHSFMTENEAMAYYPEQYADWARSNKAVAP